MNLDLLQNLINEGSELSSTILYVPSGENEIRFHAVYRTSQPAPYQNWQSSVQRFIKTYATSELEDLKIALKSIHPDNHLKILSLLNAIKLLPSEPEPLHKPQNKTSSAPNITITNTQTQNNSQQIILNIFLEAIKDEITGKDLKALQKIVKDHESEPEEAKSKLLEKLKSFGSDVLTNIVANIITNPNIYSGFI